MKRFILVIRYKTIKNTLFLAFTMIILFLFINYLYDNFENQDDTTIFNTLSKASSSDLKSENEKLRNILNSIFPTDDKVIYENPYRLYNENIPAFQTYTLADIIVKGQELNFNKIVDDPTYLRPIYDPRWKETFYRNWLYFPYKMSEARHKLFVYYGGASNIYDFEGSLGLDLESGSPVDYHKNINFLVYHFNVDLVVSYKNQIVLRGTPSDKGLQIISVKVNDILPKEQDSKEFLFQLSTPEGYEIDYYYGNYERSDYLKKLQEEEETKTTFFLCTDQNTLDQLIKENLELKKELSNYIPLDNKTLTEQKCLNIANTTFSDDLVAIVTQGIEIKYQIAYQNATYLRPIYDPIWKEYAEKAWAFLPNKMCENMHTLFVLPTNGTDQIKYLTTLGFHGKITTITKDTVGLLLYNFIPSKVIQLNNQVAIIGTPSRLGVYFIYLPSDYFIIEKNYIFKLITPDYFVID